jgi:toxin FitB
MVILDTNIISEALSQRPNTIVKAWLREQPVASIFTTSVTEAEILRGLRDLPDGKRKRDLEAAVQPIFERDFAGRVLPFDSEAAHAYADLIAVRRKIGRPIGSFDAQIAGIAISRGAAIATRNTKDFSDVGLALINPWGAMDPN